MCIVEKYFSFQKYQTMERAYEKSLTTNLQDINRQFIALDPESTRFCIDDFNKVTKFYY